MTKYAQTGPAMPEPQGRTEAVDIMGEEASLAGSWWKDMWYKPGFLCKHYIFAQLQFSPYTNVDNKFIFSETR